MRRLDWYITSSFVPLLLFGVGAFLVILVGVDLLPNALRMVVRQSVPLPIAAKVFIYRLPTMIALTVPMAMMFASFMTVAGLSSHGELLALRAGGIPFLRVAASVIIAGLLLSLVTLGLNEGLSPGGNKKAFHLLKEHQRQGKPVENMIFWLPTKDTPRFWFRLGRFDPKARRAENITVIKLREDGSVWQIFDAEYGQWEEETWILNNAVQRVITEGVQQRMVRLNTTEVVVGKSAQQIEEIEQDPDEMSIAQLRRLLQERQALQLPYKPYQLELLQIIQRNLALPWCTLGFAMLGVALGQRPLRASAGVGFGVSLAIVFFYYLVFNSMILMGERGVLSPAITAWTPNAILFAIGLALLHNSRK